MDHAILERLKDLYNVKSESCRTMPMTIQTLGNSSVATIPTMYDLIRKGKLGEHKINEGDYLVFASVGAGMNVNAFYIKHDNKKRFSKSIPDTLVFTHTLRESLKEIIFVA